MGAGRDVTRCMRPSEQPELISVNVAINLRQARFFERRLILVGVYR